MEIEIPKEAVEKYLERRKVDIDSCRQALQSGNLTVCETVGHQLKGNGAMFGFPEISSVGRSLEKAAKEHDNAAAARFVDELESIVKKSSTLH
ncbi:MAG: Hpt domain-containing protein [Bdellovibrionota bacterium]